MGKKSHIHRQGGWDTRRYIGIQGVVFVGGLGVIPGDTIVVRLGEIPGGELCL